MRTQLSLALILSLFIAAGCDGNSNPSDAIHDTVWVVDSGGQNTRSITGRVKLMHMCDVEQNHRGVTVTLESTGETTTTDDSGYYRFERVGKVSTNQSAVTFSKPGYYSCTYTWGSFGFNSSKNEYVCNTDLYETYNYAAKFAGDLKLDSTRYLVTKDTVVTDTNGVLIRKELVIDTAYSYIYIFPAMAYNEEDQPTTLASLYLLVSRNPQIDHLHPDLRLFVAAVQIGSSYPTPLGFFPQSAPHLGYRGGDTLYAVVAAQHDCVKDGYAPGLRKSEPLMFVLR